MKKYYSFFLLMILGVNFSIKAQQNDSLLQKDVSLSPIPQKVYMYNYVIKSPDWYKNQEKLWKTETIKDPQNEEAWRNYYFAARYASMGTNADERKKFLRSIVDEIGERIPGSYLYPYLQYYNGNYKIEHLEKAYSLKPDFADLYPDFILYNEVRGNESEKRKFCEKLYQSKEIISSLYDYNFNMLNSTEKNSLLFTNGDNDSYPAWILQEVKGIRKDVTILNVHTVFVLRDYLKMKLDERGLEIDLDSLDKENISVFLKQLIVSIKDKYPEIPVHIAPTVYEDYLKEISDKLFITGLDYRYSEEPVNNVALIKKNLEQNLRLDYLEYDWYNEDHFSQPLMDKYNMNYIPAFIELAKMYYSNDELETAKYWQDKALLLAKRTDNEDLIGKIEKWEW